MSKRQNNQVLGGLLLLSLGLVVLVYVLKWLAITAAILAVPFGVWWMFDRRRQSSPSPGRSREARDRMVQDYAQRWERR